MMRWPFVVSPAFTFVAVVPLFAEPPPANILVREAQPSAVYRDGWIDLNKNGTKDP